MVLFGSVHADEMGHANADASLEGEFAREFRGVWGRALSNLQVCGFWFVVCEAVLVLRFGEIDGEGERERVRVCACGMDEEG